MLSVNFNPFPVLTTERLMLRRISSEDVKDIFALRSNKEAMRYLDRPMAQTEQDALALIHKIEKDLTNNDGITWGICLKNDSNLVGTMGFWRIVKDHYRAEIGYMLSPSLHGQGLMQEAMEASLQFAFEKMQLHSIEANVNPNNLPSIKLLEKNRFVREAYFRENHYFNGIFMDSAIYSLVKSDR
jgi:[ribosomal protein S5]-alanine N-acetyltransferase